MKKEHPATREMLDVIAQWDESDVVVSKNFGWSRMGILGILGDYVVRHTQGDIAEIGVGESSIFLTRLAQIYNRRIYYCDISIGEMENMNSVDGVFHSNSITYVGESDAFFRNVSITPLALGFIDGEHTYEQVRKDFFNMFELLVDDGFIFLHDTYPPDDFHLNTFRCGTVYQLRQELEKRSDIDCFTFLHGAMEVGITMIRKHRHHTKLPYYKRKIEAGGGS